MRVKDLPSLAGAEKIILDQNYEELHSIKFSFRSFRLKTVQANVYASQCSEKLIERSNQYMGISLIFERASAIADEFMEKTENFQIMDCCWNLI
jgi:hypothetical protein